MVGCLNMLLLRIWVSVSCRLLNIARAAHFVSALDEAFLYNYRHFHTPPRMTSYYGEVGLLSRAGRQEQAPPCISINPHPRSSQRPWDQISHHLSRNKLFNAEISHSSPIHNCNRDKKIWCIVLHTNKALWWSARTRLKRIVPRQWPTRLLPLKCDRENKDITLSAVFLEERRKVPTTVSVGGITVPS